jgi:hypothetical protein
MLVLFDNGTPRTLARYLIDHHMVTEARAREVRYPVFPPVVKSTVKLNGGSQA